MWTAETAALVLYVTCTSYLVTKANAGRHTDGRGSSLCAPISSSTAIRFSQERKGRPGTTRSEQQNLRCSFPESLVRLNIGEQHDHGRFRVTIHVCPNVTRLVLRVSRAARISLVDANNINSRARLVSCDTGNDTVLVNHPATRQMLWVIPSKPDISGDIRLIWSYKYQPLNGKLIWSPENHKTIDPNRTKPDTRTKRSTAVDKTDTSGVKLQKLEGCGKAKSCIRFGSKGCEGNSKCHYLLTYSITNHTLLEMEIGGTTKGWIALGLSSDDKMGGDDVFVCKRKSSFDSEVQALPMSMAVPYNRPATLPVNDITLVEKRVVNDNYIYCRITKKLTDSSTGMDLTNNWFQFYAKGNIDSHGTMLKHTITPPTSLTAVSMLRPQFVESEEYKALSSSAISACFQRCKYCHVTAILGLIVLGSLLQ